MTTKRKPSTTKPKSMPKPARYAGMGFLRDISRAVDEATKTEPTTTLRQTAAVA